MRKPEAILRPFGFTLIELLTVVSIMAVLSVLALPAINSLGNSTRLSAAGRLVSNLVSVARSEAINQRTLVQLRVLTTNQTGGDDLTVHYRKLSLWKLAQTGTYAGTYVQFSSWETLPEGVMIEQNSAPNTTGSNSTASNPAYLVPPNPGTYFLNSALLNTNGNGNTYPAIPYEAGTYNYAWIEFSPTGGTTFPLTGGTTVYLLLTEAFLPSSAGPPTYTARSKTKANTIANWYQVSVTSLTGMSEVMRP